MQMHLDEQQAEKQGGSGGEGKGGLLCGAAAVAVPGPVPSPGPNDTAVGLVPPEMPFRRKPTHRNSRCAAWGHWRAPVSQIGQPAGRPV